MTTRAASGGQVAGAVLAGAIFAVANLSVMFFIGYGGLSNTSIGKSTVQLGAVYLLAELVGIYVLLAWTSKTVRNGAHIGFCIPWALLLLVVLPQMLDRRGFREGMPLLTSAALVWALRFPGEWLARKLNGDPGDGVGQEISPDAHRNTRLLTWGSITWAVLGLLQATWLLGAVPLVGTPLTMGSDTCCSGCRFRFS